MSKIIKIRKKDGSLADFDSGKISIILHKAFADANKHDDKKIKKILRLVIEVLEKSFSDKIIPSTLDVQDVIFEVLKKNKFPSVIDAYLKFLKKHKESLGFRTILGVRDDVGLSLNAIKVLSARYLLRSESGSIIETPLRMFRRIAKTAAIVEAKYKKNTKKAEDLFYSMMSNLEFLPNSPAIMNAGTKIGQLSSCFVLPVEDSMSSIFSSLKNMALIHQTGGGTGFNFSFIRPKGDIVMSTKGIASGPLSFMEIYDKATEIIKQGGRRRGANMGVMHISHPDIVNFIKSKSQNDIFQNFNISVLLTDEFMEAALKNKEFYLIHPKTGKKVKKVSAKIILEMITEASWKSGDPGVIFIDEVNRKNVLPKVPLDCTNPCGEMPLFNYESCVLGSVNLSTMIKQGKIDWDKLKKTVRNAIHFLDNLIDANKYPLEKIEEVTKANRKIGLGVMGFAQILALLKIPYDSDKAVKFAEKLMKFISETARKKSEELGKERGNFENFEKSILAKNFKNMRNATVTSIAPTGSLSLIAEATPGIEPYFAISYFRKVLDKEVMLESNKEMEEIARKKGFYSKELMMNIAKKGTVHSVKGIPKDIQKVFKSAHEIKPEWHVRIQAAFQKYVDNAISKTVNLPSDATYDDIRKVYKLAHSLGCKGITVYRDKSKKEQVMYAGICPACE